MATGTTGVTSTLSPGSSRRRRQSFAQLHSLKAGFHWRRRAELYKRLWPSENQKLEAWAESQVRRNRSWMNHYVSISSDSVWRLLLMIQWKLYSRSRKQKRKNQPITRPGIECCDRFILPLFFLFITNSLCVKFYNNLSYFYHYHYLQITKSQCRLKMLATLTM